MGWQSHGQGLGAMRRIAWTLALAASLSLALASTSHGFGSEEDTFSDPLVFYGSGCGATASDYVRVPDSDAYDLVSTQPAVGDKLTDANGQVVATISDVTYDRSTDPQTVTFTATGTDAACVADQSGATPDWSVSTDGEAVLRVAIPCSASRKGVQELFNYGVSCSTARRVAYGFPYSHGRCGGLANYYRSRTCTVKIGGRRWRCPHHLEPAEPSFYWAIHSCFASGGREVDWQIHGRYE